MNLVNLNNAGLGRLLLARTIEAIRARGVPAESTLLPFLSPPGWEHINLTGNYVWQQKRIFGGGKFIWNNVQMVPPSWPPPSSSLLQGWAA